MRIVVYQRAKEDMPFVRLALCANGERVVLRVEGGPAGSPKGVCQAGGVKTAVFEKAQLHYWKWYFGIGSQETGRLFFVPLPSADQISPDPLIFQGATSFSVRTGRTLVLPMIAIYGESYTDPPGYPDDNPDACVGVGRIDCVSFGPVYLPEPVPYAEPTPYGSNAALWIAGPGILLPPMSPGEHVIEMQVVTPSNGIFGASGYGYYNTWYVTVERP